MQTKINDYENLIGSLRAAAESITPQLSDMPKNPYLEEKLSKYVALIIDTERKLEVMKPEAEARKQKILIYVERLEDMVIKSIISLRFLELMSWVDVAKAVGGGNTGDMVRITCQRYLDGGK